MVLSSSSSKWNSMKPTVFMLLLQMTFAGMNVLYKLAIDAGMSMRVIVAYRFLFGAAFLCPVGIFMERQSRSKITWTVAMQAFCCGLFGATFSQNFYIASMKLTSVTFACAVANLLPAVTFVLAVIFRLERLGIRTLSGHQAKVVLGTAIGIGGAMLLTFYKGPKIQFWSSHMHLLLHRDGGSGAPHESGKDGNPNEWKLDVKLLTVVYSGVLMSGLMMSLMSWVIQKRGPLFVSVFNPLMLIIVAFLGSIFLDEILHLGSVLGGLLIVLGLYVVLWRKSKEMQKLAKLPNKRPSARAPSIAAVTVPVHPEGTSPPEAEKLSDLDDQVAPKSLHTELV